MKNRLLIAILLFFNLVNISQNLQWVQNTGSINADEGISLSIDKSGNIYSTGIYIGAVDFDTGPMTYNLNSNGNSDIYITKLNDLGNLLWAKSFHSTYFGVSKHIIHDSLNNIYITGNYSGTTDFDPSLNTYSLSSIGTNDAFITKLDSNGNFIWAKSFGALSNNASALSSSLDIYGNIYITGYFGGEIDFDPGMGVFNLTSNGGSDIFILKLNTSGNFMWAKNIGGTAYDYGKFITTDNKYIYTTGNFKQIVDFDPNLTTYTLSSNGNEDAFITKLDSGGNFMWAKSIGGNFIDYGQALVIDSLRNICTMGYFYGNVDFDPGIGTYSINSTYTNTYILKLDSLGNFIWAKSLGGNNSTIGFSMNQDFDGNIYTVGFYKGTTDFDPNSGTFNITSFGNEDVFVSKLDFNGGFVWAKSFGGSSSDQANYIIPDKFGNVYTTGYFNSLVDFDPNSGLNNLTSNGSRDIFISKLGPSISTNQTTFLKNQNFLTIFPNPNNGTFTITSKEKINLTIINNLGQTIQSLEINENTNFQQNITINTSGIYYISGNTDKKIIKQKIIVTK